MVQHGVSIDPKSSNGTHQISGAAGIFSTIKYYPREKLKN